MPEPVFLITGASGGIGAATARAAVRAGYRVALTGRRAAPLRDLAADLGGPARAMPVICDVSDWDQVSALVSEVHETLGRLDVVFANAGQSAPTSFLGQGGLSPGEWHGLVAANVLGPALTARAVLPALARSGGHLLLTGSRGQAPGRRADPKLAPADVAAAVMYAVGQPAGVDVSEIVIRPVGQDPFR